MSPDAELAVACAGVVLEVALEFDPVEPELDPEPVPDPVPVPESAPAPADGEVGVLLAEPEAWPGLRFSGACAASAVKASIVLLPVAALSMKY